MLLLLAAEDLRMMEPGLWGSFAGAVRSYGHAPGRVRAVVMDLGVVVMLRSPGLLLLCVVPSRFLFWRCRERLLGDPGFCRLWGGSSGTRTLGQLVLLPVASGRSTRKRA